MTKYSFLVFRSKRVDLVFFIAHEEYLGAVALTGYTRGDHTHRLVSYLLVRSSAALRLLILSDQIRASTKGRLLRDKEGHLSSLEHSIIQKVPEIDH